jgi:hypothetical protein
MYRLCVHLAADRIGIASSNTPKEARRFQVDKIAAAGFGKFFWRFEILKFSDGNDPPPKMTQGGNDPPPKMTQGG